MSLLRYTHLAYAIGVWIFIFVFIKPKRIWELLPAGIIGLIVIFITDEFLITLGSYQFNKPLVNVLGTPLFHLIFGAGSGIVFIHYIRKQFSKKLLVVLFFTLITLALEYAAEMAGVASRLDNYGRLHSLFVDFSALIMLLFFAEGFIGDKLYYKNRKF